MGWYARTAWQAQRRRRTRFDPITSLMTVARVTLSYWAAGQVYIAAGGRLPLGRLPADLMSITLPLIVFALVYVTLYFAIFVLEAYVAGYALRGLISADLSRVAVILILPIPFSILGAEIISTLEDTSKAIFLAGVVLIVLALYALSVSENRLRRQLDEVQTLAVVTRAMRTHLDLDALLRTIYVQVADLLDIENFEVVLYDLDEQRLNFSLRIRSGQEQAAASEPFDRHENTLLGYLLRSESPLLIADQVQERAREYGLHLPESTIVSWLGTPLQAGGRILGGVVVASHDERRKFTRNDLRLLNIVAASGSIAIENAQLYAQQMERAEQLVTLNRLNALMSETLSPDTIQEIVISSASMISNSQAVGLYTFGDEGGLQIRGAGLSNTFLAQNPRPLLVNGDGPTMSQPALTVSDVSADARLETHRPLFLQERKLGFIELALAKGDQAVGVLTLYYDQPQVFSSDKVELLKTFANQAAQAIINAQRYSTTDAALQRSVDQLLALAAIGRLLASTIDLKAICNLVLSHAAAATAVETGVVILFEPGTQKPAIGVSLGYGDGQTDDLRTLSLAIPPNVVGSRRSKYIDDVRAQQDFTPVLPATRAVLSVPIVQSWEVFGVITLESERPGAFRPEDEQFVSQIANQASIAISNARLFQRISEERDRIKVLLDAMEEGILLIDAHGKIVLANPRIDLIGLRQADLINQSLLELLDRPEVGLVQKAGFLSREDARDLVAGMRTFRAYAPVMYVIQGEMGALHIRRQIVPVRDEHGETLGVLLVFYNKTEEQELAQSREEVSRMIVHDLRSPLTAVTTSLKLLREVVPADAEYFATVEMTTDASRRAIKKLLSRVDSLLDVAKMESGQIKIEAEPTELADLAENVRRELLPLAQELNIRLEAAISPALLPLNVDADKLERVLLNLVDNAIKYSPRGGAIQITHAPLNGHDAHPGFVRIDIIDQGPGVPPEYKQTLFDRFVQIEGRRKVRRGVGLGLTFCRLVVEAHGGKIWIDDNPGGGSIFSFTMPLVSLEGVDDEA